ncbi:MAG: hypothetical protein LBL87_05025 [Ruminococcus sp.]|jgi:hypothetical protein|nr:hypothetical protein [Ruminococcus sp.]
MLKWQKSNAIELIKTMTEAHNALSALIGVPQGQESATLLKGGCIECVHALCDIDDIFKSTAEEYCGFVESARTPEDALSLNVYADVFLKLLEKAKIKLEFVFFTYKTSMFDSFETLVRAAQADPDIEAFVVPIPYYNRNEDFSFGQMYFENMKGLPQYSDLNIVDFSHYDLALRRPDAVFFNNPYDNNNAVTSVHPDYYSDNLRPYTDLLVYIPYFILGEFINNSADMLPSHFVETYGCIFADRVIVQSSSYAAAYAKKFEAVGKIVNNAFAFGKPNEKFIPLGSPKIEKVLTDKPDNYDIPDEWKKKIYNADGSKKTVVFLNTGVSGVLYYTTEWTRQIQIPLYFEKLEAVLREFENRSDCVLIWRPHPFMEETLRSNRPQLLGRYKKILSDFSKTDFGILDMSEDFHPAFTLADAYFGDGSSLVPLFAVTAKPIFMMNPVVSEKQYLIDSHIVIGDKIYFTVSGIACLFLGDFSGGVKIAAKLPVISDCALLRFSGIAENGGKLYIAPASASEIVVFDISSGDVTTLDFDREKIKNGDPVIGIGDKFKSVFSDGDYLYFVGRGYPAIIKYNAVSGETTYIDNYIKNLLPRTEGMIEKRKNALTYDCAYSNGFVYIVTNLSDEIISVNLQNGKSENIKVGVKTTLSNIAVNENIAAVASGFIGSPLILYNLKTKKTVSEVPFPDKFDNPYPEENQFYNRFSKLLYSGGAFWIFPGEAHNILRLPESGEAFEKITSYTFGERDRRNFDNANTNGDKLFYSSYAKKPTLFYNDGECKEIIFDIDFSESETVIGRIPVSIFTYWSFIFEMPDFTLECFLDSLRDGIYAEKAYSDEYTEHTAKWGIDTSKRILGYCKEYLKKEKKYVR